MFDRNFPRDRGRYIDVGVRILYRLSGRAFESLWLLNGPQKDIRVEKDPSLLGFDLIVSANHRALQTGVEEFGDLSVGGVKIGANRNEPAVDTEDALSARIGYEASAGHSRHSNDDFALLANLFCLDEPRRTSSRNHRLPLRTRNMAKVSPIHPGEVLLEDFMVPQKLTANKLALELRVPSNRISDLIRGERSITPDTALRLAAYFETSVELWIGLQSQYDLAIADDASGEQIRREVHAIKT